MSREVKVTDVELTNQQAIESAVKELIKQGIACELKQDAYPRMYFGNSDTKCEYVINLKDCQFDVGLHLEDGKYVPVFDSHDNVVLDQIGYKTEEDTLKNHIGKFLQQYNLSLIRQQCSLYGYTEEQVTIDEHGNLNLLINVA